MRLNETVLKSLPLLVTRNEANQGQRGLMLAQCLRVSVAPNEATLASFPASSLGVKGIKWSQMSPQFEKMRTAGMSRHLEPCA